MTEHNELALLDDFGEDWEVSLRPESLDDFIGQDQLVRRLRFRIEAAKKRGQPLPHMLFTGPPGLGKTSFALLIAKEMGVNMQETSGDAFKNSGDIYSILAPMEDGDILFIDEIHKLNKSTAEALYPACEDFKVPLILGRGANAQVVTEEVPHFTLVGATTDTGKIRKPLKERFQFKDSLVYYSVEELTMIAMRSAYAKGLEIAYEAAEMIGRRSRGTPRRVNNLLSGLADFALVFNDTEYISGEIAEGFFDIERIDSRGLEERERAYLKVLCEKFEGCFVGVKNVGAVLGENVDALEDLEEWLLHENLVIKNVNGRAATREGYIHLGMSYPNLKGTGFTL